MKSCRVIQTDTFFLHIPGRYVLRSKLFQNFFLPLNYVRKNLSKVKRTAYFSLKDFDIRDSKRAFLQLFPYEMNVSLVTRNEPNKLFNDFLLK